jgi:hypothetical protein
MLSESIYGPRVQRAAGVRLQIESLRKVPRDNLPCAKIAARVYTSWPVLSYTKGKNHDLLFKGN